MSRLGPCLAALLLAGCASHLTDSMAETMDATRASQVKAMDGLAESAARLPAVLDRTDAVLAQVQGTASLASSAAAAVDRLGGLIAALEQATRLAVRLGDKAERETDATRADRERLVASLAAIASSTQGLVARAEQAARRWEERAGDLEAHELRVVRAIADLSEATARAGAGVADLTSAARAATPTVTAILGDARVLSGRLVTTEERGSVAVFLLLGALGALGAAGVVLGLRRVWERAVEREARRRAPG